MKPNVTRFELDDPGWAELLGPDMDAWLNSWTSEEHARYGGQYVAVTRDRRVVAADRSASGLQRKLDRLGVAKARVFYLEPPDVYVVYAIRA